MPAVMPVRIPLSDTPNVTLSLSKGERPTAAGTAAAASGERDGRDCGREECSDHAPTLTARGEPSLNRRAPPIQGILTLWPMFTM
jgi:hypothetical protein